MRHFFFYNGWRHPFQQSISPCLVFFLDLALLYVPQRTKTFLYVAMLFSRCKSLPWILTRSWTNLTISYTSKFSSLQPNSFPSTLTMSGKCLPFSSCFLIPSNSASILSVKHENSRFTFVLSPSWPLTLY